MDSVQVGEKIHGKSMGNLCKIFENWGEKPWKTKGKRRAVHVYELPPRHIQVKPKDLCLYTHSLKNSRKQHESSLKINLQIYWQVLIALLFLPFSPWSHSPQQGGPCFSSKNGDLSTGRAKRAKRAASQRKPTAAWSQWCHPVLLRKPPRPRYLVSCLHVVKAFLTLNPLKRSGFSFHGNSFSVHGSASFSSVQDFRGFPCWAHG